MMVHSLNQESWRMSSVLYNSSAQVGLIMSSNLPNHKHPTPEIPNLPPTITTLLS